MFGENNLLFVGFNGMYIGCRVINDIEIDAIKILVGSNRESVYWKTDIILYADPSSGMPPRSVNRVVTSALTCWRSARTSS